MNKLDLRALQQTIDLWRLKDVDFDERFEVLLEMYEDAAEEILELEERLGDEQESNEILRDLLTRAANKEEV